MDLEETHLKVEKEVLVRPCKSYSLDRFIRATESGTTDSLIGIMVPEYIWLVMHVTQKVSS